MEYLVSAVNSPAVLSAFAKIYANRSGELTMQEAIALEYYLGANMVLFENNHLQYELGFLSEEHWQRNIAELICTLELPEHRRMMRNWDYRASFQKVINDIIDQIAPGRG